MLDSRLFLFGIFLLAVPARADVTFQRDAGPATLVELYTSEGCSSCPPAEAWLSRLKDSPQLWQRIFPVAFHVDYWDGLGWPDRFAKAAYTNRQRDYAAKLGQDSVYTPEFVTNGREWRGWFQGDLTLPDHSTSGRLTLTVRSPNRAISADYHPAPNAAPTTYILHVALLGLGIASDVQRGENAGQQLRHDFIVLDFQSHKLSPSADGHFRSGPVAAGDTAPDVPQAVVAWIGTPDEEIVQIVGGPLR